MILSLLLMFSVLNSGTHNDQHGTFNDYYQFMIKFKMPFAQDAWHLHYPKYGWWIRSGFEST